MRKPTICICENKDADQLHGNHKADQHLCFCYMDSTLLLLLKSEISSFWPASVLVQLGLCRTCSETTLLVFSRDGSNVHVFRVIILPVQIWMAVFWCKVVHTVHTARQIPTGTSNSRCLCQRVRFGG